MDDPCADRGSFSCARADLPVSYTIDAALSDVAPQVRGAVEIRFRNTSTRRLGEVVLVLFANRFAAPDRGVNDFNRAYLYPGGDFVPGSLGLGEVKVEGSPVLPEILHRPHVPDGTFVRVPIDGLEPNAAITLSMKFQTVLPPRFGTFGTYDGQLTAIGGWHPHVAALSPDGSWQLGAPPEVAAFEVNLQRAAPLQAVVGGRFFEADERIESRSVGRFVPLVAAPVLLSEWAESQGQAVRFVHRPGSNRLRISPEPPVPRIVADTLADILARRHPALPPPGDEPLLVVEAPMRLRLSAPGEGIVVVSDRTLRVHPLIRPFHEAQLAGAVYRELLRPRLARSESGSDAVWVGEALGHLLAKRYVAQARPDAYSVQDWIDLFNIFAVVDRFEAAPQIPFVEAFFDRARDVDPLRGELLTFYAARPPGWVVLDKVRGRVGERRFDALIDGCIGAAVPLRDCLSGAVADLDVDALIDPWLQPYPKIDYRVEDVDLNEWDGTKYLSRVTVTRESSRSVSEPVTVRLEGRGGAFTDLQWNSPGSRAQMTARTDDEVCRAIIDPERRLIDDDRADNARPPIPQVVLDSAELEISSTEFGLSGLVVARARHDYHKDVGLAGFFTNRSLGFTIGPRVHFGELIDPARHRHNLYLFYGYQDLNGDFDDDANRRPHTDGQLASLGLRYDYTNAYGYDNPAGTQSLRIYADVFHDWLGTRVDRADEQPSDPFAFVEPSEFYVDYGAVLTLTHPLGSHSRIGALQVHNGFIDEFDDGFLPQQGLYSLGGYRSIRGIGAEEELGANIFVARAEIRQDLPFEIDHSFLDALVGRGFQVRLFADTGKVSDEKSHVYDVADFAVGVGVGFAVKYEFLGFFPSIAYLGAATRVDESDRIDDVQFLFGTRQAF